MFLKELHLLVSWPEFQRTSLRNLSTPGDLFLLNPAPTTVNCDPEAGLDLAPLEAPTTEEPPPYLEPTTVLASTTSGRSLVSLYCCPITITLLSGTWRQK